ncbi:MAG: ATP synthase F0 subunit B [Acidobacteriota bacterium]|nr:ATP synthase F0 subunit B [Acidobacteriota bacterium]
MLSVGVVMLAGMMFGQGTPQNSPSSTEPSTQSISSSPVATPATAATPDAAKAEPGKSGMAAQKEEEEEEHAEFKYAGIVRKVAAATGLSKEAVYWIFLIINFLILASGLGWVVKKSMPQGFAPRTAEIKKGLEEARKASAEASARLGEIEGRLAKLDAEIAEIKAAADADFSVEEQRIKLAAEEDAKNVIASAELEIAAAARNAQRDLKAYAAGLAVDLAEKKIKVDEAADAALVRSFAVQLGKDDQ